MKTRDANPLREARKKQLLEDIADAKSALDRAYSNFENVIDPDLIDSSIYELQAVQLKYRFLLKQAELLDLSGG
ncbi:MAG: YaaL family protein [Lachnospiraceae bacterium]|nr:YaaL family protein [Lachnospiraceae bacterium]